MNIKTADYQKAKESIITEIKSCIQSRCNTLLLNDCFLDINKL